MAGFTHAAHHDAALAIQDQLQGGEKVLVNARNQRLYRGGFDHEHFACEVERFVG